MPLPEPTPIRRVEFAGNDGAAIGPSSGAGRIVREAGAILSPSGAPSPIPFDGSNSRETFTGDAVAFNRLIWAGTRTLTERAADLVAVEATSGFATAPEDHNGHVVSDGSPQGCPVVVETPAAYPPTEGSALRPDASEVASTRRSPASLPPNPFPLSQRPLPDF